MKNENGIEQPQPRMPGEAPGMRQNMRYNYVLHGIEGGLFMGGMAFLSAETVMPAMVHSLGGPAWLIALMPVMMMLGLTWPPLATAHWVERQPRLKAFVLFFGVFQRLPFLLGGIFLCLAGSSVGWPVVAVVALIPFVAGIMNGLCFGAWIELVSRTIPPRRRASLAAFRNIIGALLGLFAGVAIHWVLKAYPGVQGYGLLHLITFGLLISSFIVFALVRETPWHERSNGARRTLAENLRSLPSLLGSDPQLRNFLFTRFFFAGYFILIPFLSVHALEVTGRPESFLGSLVIFGILGQLTGNVLGGFIGDRHGGKLVIIVAIGIFFCLAAGAAVVSSSIGFLLIFFLSGMVYSMDIIGRTTLSIEICPHDRRATYLSLINTISLPAFLLAAGISYLVREISSGMLLFSIVSSASMACALIALSRVREPRNTDCSGAIPSPGSIPCEQGGELG